MVFQDQILGMWISHSLMFSISNILYGIDVLEIVSANHQSHY